MLGQKTNVDYGRIDIPKNLALPKPKDIGPLYGELAHDVKTDTLIIIDSKTILIKNLYYDGLGPDAYFMVGLGSKPGRHGTKVPDENGSLKVLSAYRGKNVLLRLPGDITLFDIDWFSIYCITFRHDFAHYFFTPKVLEGIPANVPHLKSILPEVSRCRGIRCIEN